MLMRRTPEAAVGREQTWISVPDQCCVRQQKLAAGAAIKMGEAGWNK